MADPIEAQPLIDGSVPIDPNAVAAPEPLFVGEQRKQELRKKSIFDFDPNDNFLSNPMSRQDWFIDGAVRAAVGSQFSPDDNFNPSEPTFWKHITEGVAPEFHAELYDTVSPAHAEYIKDALLRKQAEQERLGAMDGWGQAGRLAYGVLEPTQYLAGFGAGAVAARVSKLGKAQSSLNAALAAKNLSAAAKSATDVAVSATQARKPAAVAAGLGSGAAGNAAFEYTRQRTNFESDGGAMLMAGLVGLAFSAPFVGLKVREMNKLTATAGLEAKVLTAFDKINNKVDLTPEDQAAIGKYVAAMDAEAGRMSSADIAAIKGRIDEQADAASAEVQAHIKAQADKMAAEFAPAADNSPWPWPSQAKMDAEAAAGAAKKELEVEAMAQRLGSLIGTAGIKAAEAWKAGRLAAAIERLKSKKTDAIHAGEVVFRNDSGKWDGGKIVHFNRQTKMYKVDRFPDYVGPTPQGLERFVWVSKQDMHPRSGHYEAPHTGKGFGPKAPENTTAMAEAFRAATVAKAAKDARVNEELRDLLGKAQKQKEIDAAYAELQKVKEADVVRAEIQRELNDAGITESGFLPGSVGSGQIAPIDVVDLPDLDGVDIPVRTVDIPFFGGKKITVRYDYSAILAGSGNPILKEFAFRAMKDPVGWNVDGVAQGRTASEHKSNIRRVVTGAFYRGAREAFNEYAAAMGWGKIQKWRNSREFFEEATLLTRWDRPGIHAEIEAKYQGKPAALAALQKASAAQKKMYSTLLEMAKEAGVRHADEVSVNDFYANRVWNHDKIRHALMKFNDDEFFFQAFSNSFSNVKVRGDAKAARKFFDAIKKTEFADTIHNLPFVAKDAYLLRSELENAGLTTGEIDLLIDTMFEAAESTGDKGAAPQLKFRFKIDENFTVAHPTTGEMFRVSDLLENDSLVLAERYTQSMGGHIGLARAGWKSVGEVRTMFKEAEAWHGENEYRGKDADAFKRHLKTANDALNHIIGRPMSGQVFDRTGRVLTAMRGYTRFLMLGQLGVAAASEAGNAAALLTWRSMIHQMPSLGQFISGLKHGYVVDKPLARQIELMMGFGNEMQSAFARNAQTLDFATDAHLTLFERGANIASHAGDIMSGNAGITSMFRQWTAMSAVQHMFEQARKGSGSIGQKTKARWIQAGISEAEIDPVLADFKAHTKASSRGVVQSIDYEGWQQANQKTYDKFTLWVERMTRDAIQDPDIGEVMPWTQTPIGRIFSELRNFMLVAHAKQFLKNVYHHDMVAARAFGINMLAQGLFYSLQVSANYAHDPKRRDEMLSLDRIATSAFSRAGSLGIISFPAATAYEFFTRDPWSGSTVNTDNRNMFITPSMQVAMKGVTAARGLAGVVAGPFTGDTFTYEEAKAAGGMLPNYFLLRNITDYWASGFPKADQSLQQ